MGSKELADSLKRQTGGAIASSANVPPSSVHVELSKGSVMVNAHIYSMNADAAEMVKKQIDAGGESLMQTVEECVKEIPAITAACVDDKAGLGVGGLTTAVKPLKKDEAPPARAVTPVSLLASVGTWIMQLPRVRRPISAVSVLSPTPPEVTYLPIRRRSCSKPMGEDEDEDPALNSARRKAAILAAAWELIYEQFDSPAVTPRDAMHSLLQNSTSVRFDSVTSPSMRQFKKERGDSSFFTESETQEEMATSSLEAGRPPFFTCKPSVGSWFILRHGTDFLHQGEASGDVEVTYMYVETEAAQQTTQEAEAKPTVAEASSEPEAQEKLVQRAKVMAATQVNFTFENLDYHKVMADSKMTEMLKLQTGEAIAHSLQVPLTSVDIQLSKGSVVVNAHVFCMSADAAESMKKQIDASGDSLMQSVENCVGQIPAISEALAEGKVGLGVGGLETIVTKITREADEARETIPPTRLSSVRTWSRKCTGESLQSAEADALVLEVLATTPAASAPQASSLDLMPSVGTWTLPLPKSFGAEQEEPQAVVQEACPEEDASAAVVQEASAEQEAPEAEPTRETAFSYGASVATWSMPLLRKPEAQTAAVEISQAQPQAGAPVADAIEVETLPAPTEEAAPAVESSADFRVKVRSVLMQADAKGGLLKALVKEAKQADEEKVLERRKSTRKSTLMTEAQLADLTNLRALAEEASADATAEAEAKLEEEPQAIEVEPEWRPRSFRDLPSVATWITPVPRRRRQQPAKAEAAAIETRDEEAAAAAVIQKPAAEPREEVELEAPRAVTPLSLLPSVGTWEMALPVHDGEAQPAGAEAIMDTSEELEEFEVKAPRAVRPGEAETIEEALEELEVAAPRAETPLSLLPSVGTWNMALPVRDEESAQAALPPQSEIEMIMSRASAEELPEVPSVATWCMLLPRSKRNGGDLLRKERPTSGTRARQRPRRPPSATTCRSASGDLSPKDVASKRPPRRRRPQSAVSDKDSKADLVVKTDSVESLVENESSQAAPAEVEKTTILSPVAEPKEASLEEPISDNASRESPPEDESFSEAVMQEEKAKKANELVSGIMSEAWNKVYHPSAAEEIAAMSAEAEHAPSVGSSGAVTPVSHLPSICTWSMTCSGMSGGMSVHSAESDHAHAAAHAAVSMPQVLPIAMPISKVPSVTAWSNSNPSSCRQGESDAGMHQAPSASTQVNFKFENLDYDKVIASSELTESLKRQTKEALAVSTQVPLSSVDVTLSKGSVVVNAHIRCPHADAAELIKKQIDSNGESLMQTIDSTVAQIPTIADAVVDGQAGLGVTGLQASVLIQEVDLAREFVPDGRLSSVRTWSRTCSGRSLQSFEAGEMVTTALDLDPAASMVASYAPPPQDDAWLTVTCDSSAPTQWENTGNMQPTVQAESLPTQTPVSQLSPFATEETPLQSSGVSPSFEAEAAAREERADAEAPAATPSQEAGEGLFEKLDANHDGVISRQEFESAMRSGMLQEGPKPDAEMQQSEPSSPAAAQTQDGSVKAMKLRARVALQKASSQDLKQAISRSEASN